MTNVCEKFASLHQLKFSTNVDVDQEWKLPILHELLKVKEDNMFRLETIFIYCTLFLFLSYHIVTFYLCVRNKSIIIKVEVSSICLLSTVQWFKLTQIMTQKLLIKVSY